VYVCLILRSTSSCIYIRYLGDWLHLCRADDVRADLSLSSGGHQDQ